MIAYHRWTVRLERDNPQSLFAVRAPSGEPYGFFVPTCLGHSLAIRHARRCAELADLKKLRVMVARLLDSLDHINVDGAA